MHEQLENNINIKLSHCYSHMKWVDEISLGNNAADTLATNKIKQIEENREKLKAKNPAIELLRKEFDLDL